jgi:mannose-6-phosphate isomerase class I
MAFRNTTQHLLPARREPAPAGQYDIYPSFPLGAGRIRAGYDALAGRLAGSSLVVLDGYAGTLWQQVRADLEAAFLRLGVKAAWVCVDQALKPPVEIEHMLAPFLGGDDPLFGTRFTGSLADFFDPAALALLRPDPSARLTILYGCGAALAGWDGLLVYLDLPKNELQFRARAGQPTNLGLSQPLSPKPAYKRSYFVDWPALNAHKAALLPRLDVVVDAQRPDQPLFISGVDFRAALERMSLNYFRVRPWFEPGPWGGQWIKERFPQLSREASNYAWSFELIFPENGLLLESSGWLLEVTFDWLMAQSGPAILGDAYARFGLEFPIRFDFLDTVQGGNLSIQCHPRPEYILSHFGENFTQDETYYILDCTPDARVYLGFQAGLDPSEFRSALETSYAEAAPLDVQRFVQAHPAAKHDLFLIPNGTIHGAGQGNLVLEISATPYIFTFKMYDWLRPDLDGKPRPLNISRAFENLYFERQGDRVQAELLSKPALLASGPGWQVIHLPTHPAQFFDVHRLDFERSIEVETNGQAHVLSLVEGDTIALETGQGMRQRFHYAETFVVPAAARGYRLINEGSQPVKVVKAFVKPGALQEGQR